MCHLHILEMKPEAIRNHDVNSTRKESNRNDFCETTLAIKSVGLPNLAKLGYAEQGAFGGTCSVFAWSDGFLALVRTGAASSARLDPSHRTDAKGPWRFEPAGGGYRSQDFAADLVASWMRSTWKQR